ncbi:MAG: protein kinase domain-containing protein, partial [Persicimonas sp.]
MKICPECERHFEGAKAFCPYDGTKLVDAQERPSGALVGETLGEAIEIQSVELADGLGERYRGRHKSEDESLRVTVFEQDALGPEERKAELGAAAAGLPGELPPQILSIQWMGLGSDPPFLAERAPRGPSLRSLLDERGRLDWRTATRIASNIARAVSFLAEHGIIHRGLHSHAVFVTDLEEGHIELGEWAHGQLTYRRHPLAEAQETPDAFVGYPAYLAPESIRDAEDTDERSLVYAIGTLLYEMIAGKPPFTSEKTAELLRRQLQEQPLKLSMAAEKTDYPAELEEILEMMLDKDAERRFQLPRAIIGALGSLVDASPGEIAPEIAVPSAEEASEQADREGDGEPTERDASSETPSSAEEDGDDAYKTMAGSPAVSVVGGVNVGETAEPLAPDDKVDAASDGERDEAAKDSSTEEPSIVIDESGLGDENTDGGVVASADRAAASDAEEEKTPDDDEADTDESGTLMLGTVEADGGAPVADAASAKETAKTEKSAKTDGDDAPKKTLLMGTTDGDDGDDAKAKPESTGEESADDDSNEVVDRKAVAPTPEASKRPSSPAEGADRDDESERVDEAPRSGEGAGEEADAATDDAKTGDEGPQVGVVEAPQGGDEGFDDDWFGSEANDTWESSDLVEPEDSSEVIRRHLTKGIFVLLALGVVGLFIFVENYEEPTDEEAKAEG